jgi:hypothetical protein
MQVLESLTMQLLHQYEATRQASLRWLLMLREKVPVKVRKGMYFISLRLV